MAAFQAAARRLQCGVFLTETDDANANATGATADTHLQSWLFWEYKSYVPMTGSNNGFWQPNGSLDLSKVSHYTRTYATAVAGHTQVESKQSAEKTHNVVTAVGLGTTQESQKCISFESRIQQEISWKRKKKLPPRIL
eukprot:TRINITY_DN4975_c0_g1_i1.p2 TRINITY_DN4975_c0_g1~~TRINITY_DN4975_c0_g1_i1.p2  ORF type:complete len:138 (-),score=24.67 TRINITY_DN4975_c0_g1_i1:267-680(-)